MHDNLVIDIAGFRVALQIADERMAARTLETYSEFVSLGNAEHTVQVSVRPGASFLARQPGVWAMQTSLSGEQLSFRSYDDAGSFDFGTGKGQVELSPEAGLENFLRVLYGHLCARSGALLLHAAGVVRAGMGYVFFGPSGSGKSTSSQLSREAGCTVLSDDLVILRGVDHAYRVYGVPFRGTAMEIPRTRADAPLAGIYELVKDAQHFLAPLDRPHAVAALSRSVPFVMATPPSSGKVIAFCAQLSQTLQPAQLHFRKDDGFWKVIDDSRATLSRAS